MERVERSTDLENSRILRKAALEGPSLPAESFCILQTRCFIRLLCYRLDLRNERHMSFMFGRVDQEDTKFNPFLVRGAHCIIRSHTDMRDRRSIDGPSEGGDMILLQLFLYNYVAVVECCTRNVTPLSSIQACTCTKQKLPRPSLSSYPHATTESEAATGLVPKPPLPLVRPHPPRPLFSLDVPLRREIHKDLLPPHLLCTPCSEGQRRLLRHRGPGAQRRVSAVQEV